MTNAHPSIDPVTDLSALFNARSVVVIGASDDPEKIAGRPLAAMKHYGFAGGLYVVNARRAQVQGLRSYPSVADLPEVPDLAVLAVPSASVIDAVRQCGKAGVRFAVVFAGGFAETGDEGRQQQHALTEAARESGIRVLGPNCLGAMDFNRHVYATFSRTTDEVYEPGQRGLAVVSQSGALGNYMLTQAMDQDLPVVKWITTGNESDLEFAEVLQSLVFDPDVTGILAYQEGARDGRRLRAAMRDAQRQRKPVAIIKVGATDVGARAVVSHTDALAGDDAVYNAVFRECGVMRVDGIEPLLDAGKAMAQCAPARGKRLLLATISGGVGVIMAEAAARLGLVLPDLSGDSKRTLLDALPFMSPNNPLDVTGQVVQDFSLLQRALDLGLRDTRADVSITFIGRLARVQTALSQYLDTLKALAAQYPDTRFITVGMFEPDKLRALQRAGLLVYADPSRAVAAAGALVQFGQAFQRAGETSGPPAGQIDPDSYQRAKPPAPLNEAQCYELLSGIGIRTPAFAIASSADVARHAAASLNGPVAMKVLSRTLAHKSDVGGVRLNVDEAGAIVAYEDIVADVSRLSPGVAIDGVLVVQQVPVEVELVIGARVDPQLGPVVLLGAGGVLVEVLRDVQVHTAPLTSSQAMAMIDGLQCKPLLNAFRGRAARDTVAVADALVRLSRFAAANASWLESIEINPLVPGAEGQGAMALDCAIQVQQGEQ